MYVHNSSLNLYGWVRFDLSVTAAWNGNFIQGKGGITSYGVADQTPNQNTAGLSTDLSCPPTSTNTPPTASYATQTLDEDSTLSFSENVFGFNDADGDTLNKILVTAIPSPGTLFLDANTDGNVDSGEALANDDDITKAELDANKLKFKPAENGNGTSYSSFQFKVHDGTEPSASAYTMTINVTAVNDVPSFTKGADQSVDAGTTTAQTDTGWATSLDKGATNESAQTLSFNVTTSGDNIFSTAPAIAPNGDLTYTPNGTSGVATVSVKIQDDGGTANSGVNESAVQTFTITVKEQMTLTISGSVSEAGTTTSGTVSVPTNVTSDLTVNLVSDNTGEATVPASATILTGQNSADFTITGINDADIDGNQTPTITASASNYTDGTATVTVVDDDVVGVTVGAISGAITEGAQGSYTLKLNTNPAGSVTITATPSGQCSVDQSSIALSNTTATTINVTATENRILDGDHSCTISHSITTGDGGDYTNALNVNSVTASITDNEPYVKITQTSGSTSVVEGGATDSFEVKLGTQPIQAVTITVTPDAQIDLGQGAATASTLSFTTTDWNTAQTVTITAVDDTTVENSHSSTISLSAASSGRNYNNALFVVEGTRAASLSVNITDNDVAPTPTPVPTPTPTPTPPPSTTSPGSTIITTPTGGSIVEFAGDGSGSVSASENSSGPFSCHSSETCPTQIQIGWYRFEATADPGSEFVEWRGDNCKNGEYTTTFGGTCIAVFKLLPPPVQEPVKVTPSPVTPPDTTKSPVTPQVPDTTPAPVTPQVPDITTCPEITRLYVNQAATGEDTGCTWPNAATSLQTALQNIGTDSPNVIAVWIAKGTYYPSTDGSRNASFQLLNGVSIYGGFAGYETEQNQRNSATHPTILSGDIGIENDNSDNSYNVVNGSNTDATALLKGVIIERGNANQGDTCPEACGGGIYNDNGSPTLKHLFIRDNSAIYGGGLYNANNSQPFVKESMIDNNEAQDGGAMLNDNSGPTLSHVFITGNTASNQGGGMLNRNYAAPIMGQVNFGGNTAKLGGGILNVNSSPVLSHSTVRDNEAEKGAGIVNLNQSTPLISHVILSGNVATETGGAMLNHSSSPTLSHATISGNMAPKGSGISNETGSKTIINNSILWANINNNLNAASVPQLEEDSGSATTVNNSIVQGGWTGLGNHNLATDPLFTEPVIDPITTHTTMGDFHLKAGSPAINAGDNKLIPQDLADAECTGGFGDGNTTERVDVDFEGRTRLIGDVVDMGVYEVQTLPDAPIPETLKYNLTVILTGEGQGSVASNKDGISCGNDCSQDYLSGTAINLITNTKPGSIFGGWFGDCRGDEGHFMVEMDAAKRCTAQFDIAPIEEPVVLEPDEFALPTNTVVSSAPVNQCNTSSGKLIGVCHAHTQNIRYQTIGEEDSLSNGILDHPLTSKGLVANTTITPKGHLKGGQVSGYTQNEGLIEDVEFVGASITGKNAEGSVVGTIGGEIKLASLVGGVIEDIRLAPDTQIVGSRKPKLGSHTNRDRLGGMIIGDIEKPAILDRVHIRDKSQVSNVIIQENVTIGVDVTFTNVEFRTQVVRKVTVTGQISGTRFQNTYTKLENVTIRANSHLSNLVIGNNVKFEEGVTLEDSVTFEVHTTYMKTHSITVLPKLKGLSALDKQGKPLSTWARLEGGARMGTEGSGKKRYSKKLTLKRNPHQNVEIHGNVLTDVRHIGKRADILVVAAHTAPGATSPSFYMLDKSGTPKPWDGAISSLVPFQSRTALAPVVSVPIWNKPLDIVGDVQVNFGYRLNDGLIVYSLEEVIEITLTE